MSLLTRLKSIPKAEAKKEKEKKQEYTKIANEEFRVEGNKALLLAEACKLDKEKKKAEKRLKKIKEDLGFTEKGEYSNTAGDKLVISVAENKSEIEPQRVYNLMVKNKMVARFWGCVKIQVGELKKVIPQTAIDKMQTDLDPTVRYSFK